MDMRDMRLETARLEAERRLVRLRSEVARCVSMHPPPAAAPYMCR